MTGNALQCDGTAQLVDVLCTQVNISRAYCLENGKITFIDCLYNL